MATLPIRGLDDVVTARRRVRAAQNGWSKDAEARAILGAGLSEPDTHRGLGSRIRQRFADLDDVELVEPPRVDRPRAADYGHAQIAAICRCCGADLATRRTKDFAYTGVQSH